MSRPISVASLGENGSDDEIVSDPFADVTVSDEIAWKHRGKLDLLRRFVLGSSKLVGLIIVLIINLETLSAIRVRELEDEPYSAMMIAGFVIGGLVETLLACYPKKNKKYLPLWNAGVQSIENFLLKMFAISTFFCGYEEVPGVPNRYLPNLVCMDEHRNNVLSLFALFIPFSLLTAYMEYKKYESSDSDQVSRYRQIRTDRIRRCCLALYNKLPGSDNLTLRIVFSSATTSLATISLVSTISTILAIQISKLVPLEYELSAAGLMALVGGIIEFRRKDPNQSPKSATMLYRLNEFMRASLGNYYASVYVMVVAIPNLFDFHSLTTVEVRVIEALVYLLTLIINSMRSQDSYWYRYKFGEVGLPRIEVGDVPVEGDRNFYLRRISKQICNMWSCCCKKDRTRTPLLAGASQLTSDINTLTTG